MKTRSRMRATLRVKPVRRRTLSRQPAAARVLAVLRGLRPSGERSSRTAPEPALSPTTADFAGGTGASEKVAEGMKPKQVRGLRPQRRTSTDRPNPPPRTGGCTNAHRSTTRKVVLGIITKGLTQELRQHETGIAPVPGPKDRFDPAFPDPPIKETGAARGISLR